MPGCRDISLWELGERCRFSELSEGDLDFRPFPLPLPLPREGEDEEGEGGGLLVGDCISGVWSLTTHVVRKSVGLRQNVGKSSQHHDGARMTDWHLQS